MANPFLFGALAGLSGGLGAYGAQQRESEQKALENQRRYEDLTLEMLKLGGRPSAGEAPAAGMERIGIPVGGEQRQFDVDPLTFSSPTAARNRRISQLSGQNIPGFGRVSQQQAELFADQPNLMQFFIRDPGTVAQGAQAAYTQMRTIQDAADNIAEGLVGIGAADRPASIQAAIGEARRRGLNINESDVRAAINRITLQQQRNNPFMIGGAVSPFAAPGAAAGGSTTRGSTTRPGNTIGGTTPGFEWNPNK